jgi:hypothetical protein
MSNGVPGVEAVNAFSCTDPTNCLGSGGTGNVQTGDTGGYVIDEQHFSLGKVFAGQTLTQIISSSSSSRILDSTTKKTQEFPDIAKIRYPA